MDFSNVNLIQFIPETLLIVVVATYVLGMFLKTSKVKDKYIPSALLLFSVSIAVLLAIANTQNVVTMKAVIDAILQGILCWGVAVGVNQVAKQALKEE